MDGLNISDFFWNSSNFVLDLKENKEEIILSLDKNEFSDKIPRPSKAFVDIKKYKQLLEIKKKITNCTNWDKWTKLVNPYDKVQSVAKSKNTKDYYKFFEILKYFGMTGTPKCNIEDEEKEEEKIFSAHMGESSMNSLKTIINFFPDVSWFATNEPVQKNSGSQTALNKIDTTDDYRIVNIDPEQTVLENLITFREHVGKVNMIIGDCSCDTNHDPENQEQLVFYLLFAQVVTALHIQKENGFLLLKFFDSITRPTCQLVYYLTKFYTNVSIIKPRTSRYTNSEKFIFARNFKKIDDSELDTLDLMLNNWGNDQYLRVLGIDIPEDIEKQFFVYNEIIIDNQFKYIEKTIKCNYMEDDVPDKQLEAFQNKNALIFCNNFDIPANSFDSDLHGCKHSKKKKTQLGTLKNCTICEKCFSFVLTKN